MMMRGCGLVRGWICVGLTAWAWPAQGADVEQLFKLLADDGSEWATLGRRVDLSGDITVLGAFGDDQRGSNAGAAYLFDVTTGQMSFKLMADDGGDNDRLGTSVAIDGNLVVAGAPNDNMNHGSAYVFDATTGQQLWKLQPDGPPSGFFGWSVGISGNTIAVGAINDPERGAFAGAAFLFDATTGEQIAKLLPDDLDAEDSLGSSIAVSGDVVIIGADSQDNGGQVGAAYLYTASGEMIHKLTGEGGYFGYAVEVHGTTAIVGAFGVADNGSNSGAAYLFDTTTGGQTAKLLPDDGDELDYFGVSVDLDSSGVVVGALNPSNTPRGAAYLFDPATGGQTAKVLPDGNERQDAYGCSVAIEGSTLVVGAYGDDDVADAAGAAYVFGLGCAADFNDDGVVDTRDFVAYLNAWAAGDLSADTDGNGVVDTRDFILYLNLWAAGC